MNTLAIDTSNQSLGLAIMQDEELIAELITNIKKDHSSQLMPQIVSLMESVEMTPDKLQKIVVADGPGSYTGTRIGITTAKTMAWALDIPIDTVSSLAALAYNGRFFEGFICPLFDARRQTVFTGLYRFENNRLQQIEADCNISIHDWLEKLFVLEEDVLFLSPHINTLESHILNIFKDHAIIPEQPYHLTKPSNLLLLSGMNEHPSVHTVRPNYLRMTEAEANLQKRKKGNN